MKSALALLSALVAAPVQAQCLLCPPGSGRPALPPLIPLNVTVEASLDLGRAAHLNRTGSGTITIDPRTGARTVAGQLTDLGGMALKGSVRLTGMPLAAVAISLPSRIQLSAPDGSTAEIIDIQSNVAPNAALNILGQLTVAFGGRLIVTAGSAGDFRGRIPVTANYR